MYLNINSSSYLGLVTTQMSCCFYSVTLLRKPIWSCNSNVFLSLYSEYTKLIGYDWMRNEYIQQKFRNQTFFGNEDFASVIHLQKQSLLQKKRNISHITSSISRRVDHRNMMMARPSNFAINQPVFDIFICIFHHQHPSTISHLFSCIFFGHFYHSLTISGESCSERDKISIQNGKVFHIFSNHSPRDMSICLGICMRYIYLTSAQTTIWQTCLEHHTLSNMTDWNKPPAKQKVRGKPI